MDKSLEEKVKGKRKQVKDDYEKVYSFTLTLEDAKAYVYTTAFRRNGEYSTGKILQLICGCEKLAHRKEQPGNNLRLFLVSKG